MNKYIKPAGVVLAGVTASASLGAVAGYFLAKRHLRKHYDALLDQVVTEEREGAAKIEDHYKMVLGEAPYDTKEARTKRYLQLLDELQHDAAVSQQMSMDLGYSPIDDTGKPTLDQTPIYVEMHQTASAPVIEVPKQALSVKTLEELSVMEKVEGEIEEAMLLDPQQPETGPTSIDPSAVIEVKRVNVFEEFGDKASEDAPVEEEKPQTQEFPQFTRNPNTPYLITTEMFMEDFENYEKITLKYFAEDKTLADESDKQVPDVEGTAGLKNLQLLGEDKITELHIRNEKLRVDFEVLLELNSYSEVVLGILPERSDDG